MQDNSRKKVIEKDKNGKMKLNRRSLLVKKVVFKNFFKEELEEEEFEGDTDSIIKCIKYNNDTRVIREYSPSPLVEK